MAENIGSETIFGADPLFADDYTRYAGQPLGFVVLIFFLSLLCILVVQFYRLWCIVLFASYVLCVVCISNNLCRDISLCYSSYFVNFYSSLEHSNGRLQVCKAQSPRILR